VEQLEMALEKVWVARTDRISTPGADHDMYARLADIAANTGDTDRLARYAPLAEAGALALGHKLYLAIAHRAQGVWQRLVGEPSQAAARFAHALALFGELGARYQLGRTWLEAGELARAQGERRRARACFGHALAAFEALGAAPAAGRAWEKIRELG
jgi:hypothetical protein